MAELIVPGAGPLKQEIPFKSNDGLAGAVVEMRRRFKEGAAGVWLDVTLDDRPSLIWVSAGATIEAHFDAEVEGLMRRLDAI